MAWDKLKTVDMITKILDASKTPWNESATELLIKKFNLKNASEQSVLGTFTKIMLDQAKKGFDGSLSLNGLGDAFVKGYLKYNLKLDDKMKQFATNNLTNKELSRLMNKTDQLGALEEVIDRKYKKIFEKTTSRQKELMEDLKSKSYANNKQQLKLTPEEFLPFETFERLTFDSKMKAFEDIKKEYTDNFKSKGKRRKYVRDNAIYNNEYEPNAKDEDDENPATDEEELGIFTGLEHRSDSSFEEREYLQKEKEKLQTTLKDEYGFTNKDFKRMHNDEDGGFAINKKYGERDIYSAHSEKFQRKDFESRTNRKGEIKTIVSDPSLSRNQKFAKLSIQQAQSFKNSKASIFAKSVLAGSKRTNLGAIAKKVTNQKIKTEIKKGNTRFTNMNEYRKKNKK